MSQKYLNSEGFWQFSKNAFQMIKFEAKSVRLNEDTINLKVVSKTAS